MDENELKIKRAFVELLSNHNYLDIKISHITDKAEVNRTSFYMLWSNKDELLEDVCGHILVFFSDNFSKYQLCNDEKMKHNYIKTAFIYISEHEQEILNLLKIKEATILPYQVMEETMEKTLYQSISIKYKNIPNNNKVLYSKYYASCAMITVQWWLNNKDKRDYEYIAHVIETASTGFNDMLLEC